MKSCYRDDSEDDDDKPNIEDLFPFTINERELIDQLAAPIRKSLTTLAPPELRLMATFLFALERLPYRTEGIYLDLAISQPDGRSSSYISVKISSRVFQLSTGGWEYSPDVGGDSYSRIYLDMEAGGFREGTAERFEEWLGTFSFFATCGTYSFIETGEDDNDLTEELPEDGWDRLAAYWAWERGNMYSY